jgi:hypothetical protein
VAHLRQCRLGLIDADAHDLVPALRQRRGNMAKLAGKILVDEKDTHRGMIGKS